MADYYSILGLTKGASGNEIKTAFRKLAKLYHPDKNPDNPNAKALFENILKAYTVLSNPVTRKRYDNGYGVPATQTSTPRKTASEKSQKEWTFTEEDLKRRQYYQNYYQTKKQTFTDETKHKLYSDYKYILFATPLAVGLLMLILSVFSDTPTTTVNSSVLVEKEQIHSNDSITSSLNTGDKPYSGYFGNIKTFETTNSLQITNGSNYDAVIIVFDNQTDGYLAHAYVKPLSYIEFLMLPATGVYWKGMIGKHWNEDKLLSDQGIVGAFDSVIQCQNWKNSPILFAKEEAAKQESLKILSDELKNKQYISNEIVFFEK